MNLRMLFGLSVSAFQLVSTLIGAGNNQIPLNFMYWEPMETLKH